MLARWWHGLRLLAQADQRLLVQQWRFGVAVLGSLFIPALYALIYLSSMWDPSARTGALQAGIVNADAGVHYRDQDINIGREVTQTLIRQATFHWQTFDNTEDARLAVRRGQLSFAVLIPADFSEQAVPGMHAGAAKLTIYTSEGNSYSGAGFAKRFAPELAHRVNETLNEQRWNSVLSSAAGSKLNLSTLHERVQQLYQGSQQLSEGLHQARQGSQELSRGLDQANDASRQLHTGSDQFLDGSTQLQSGWRQLSSGLRTLDAKRPSSTDLDALKSGAQRLTQGQLELSKGLNQLHSGSLQLRQGVQSLQQSLASVPLIGDSLAEGAQTLDSGAHKLSQGLLQAQEANQQLVSGSQQLHSGVQTLANGFLQYSNGVHQIVLGLPEDSRVDSWVRGAQQLNTGTQTLSDGLRKLQQGGRQLHTGMVRLDSGGTQLRDGLALLAHALPRDVPMPEGSARGLADSVEPALEIVAPVSNDGAGFAPNFVPMSLWVGAVMAALLFNLRRLPRPAAQYPRPIQVLGKLTWPTLVVLGQAAVMVTMLMRVLDLRVQAVGPFVMTVTAASLTFLAILFWLIRCFGDLGKVMGIILLIVQLSSAGATLPIELATPFFQALHPYLPFTWVVRAFRASMFGAYDGQWLAHWGVVAGCGASALLAATLMGRWKVVDEADYHPGIEID